MRKKDVYLGRDVRTLENACVECGNILNGAFGFNFERGRKGPAPSPGDVSVCAYCAAVMIWEGDDMRLRAPTVEEAERFAHDECVQLARRLIKEKPKRKAAPG